MANERRTPHRADKVAEPSISVVIPTIGRDLLASAVESVANCPGSHEIIVADQSGTVASRDFSHIDVPVHVVHSPTKGAGINRNHGAAHANGEILAFLDDDCVASQSWVETIATFFSNRSNQIVTGRVLSTGDESNTPSTITGARPELIQHPHTGCWRLFSNNMAVRRADFVAIGGFDERYAAAAEDADLAFRWLKSGNSIAYEPSVWIHHQDWRTANQVVAVEASYEHGAGQFFATHAFADKTMLRATVKAAIDAAKPLATERLLSPTIRGVFTGLRQSYVSSNRGHWERQKAAWLECPIENGACSR